MTVATRRAGRVPNDLLRERYLWWIARDGVTASDIARWGGFTRVTKEGLEKSDTSQVERLLGLRMTAPTNKKGRCYPGYWITTLSEQQALRLARALDVDPWEIGL